MDELTIEADAIASLASLEKIEFINIGNFTLLPRSLARNNELRPITIEFRIVNNLKMHPWTFAGGNSNSNITITDVEECHMSEQTFAPSTLFHSIELAHIPILTIDHNAFASNVSVQFINIVDAISVTLQSGAFAHNSSIQKVTIHKVDSLLIESGGIEADVAKLAISDVFMATCEKNTYGDTIQSLSIVSSHIKLGKSGCISTNTGLGNLRIENSQLDHIEPFAISGILKQVQIKDSEIGIVETGGFTLNVANFSAERITIDEISEKALNVSASERIELIQCKVNILRKYAFILLYPGSNNSIILEDLQTHQADPNSLRFATGAKFIVSRLKLSISCTCDMARILPELGLPYYRHQEHVNDPKESLWSPQTHCVSNNTTPTLTEFYEKNCLGPNTKLPITTTSSSAKVRWTSGGQLPVALANLRGTTKPPQLRTGSSNTWVIIVGTITATLLMVLVVVALIFRSRITSMMKTRRMWSAWTQPSCTERQTSESSTTETSYNFRNQEQSV